MKSLRRASKATCVTSRVTDRVSLAGTADSEVHIHLFYLLVYADPRT